MKRMIRVLTAVFSVASAFVFGALAADDKVGKGQEPVAIPGVSALMLCPHCKVDYVVKLPASPKGSPPAKVIDGKHQCTKCSTALTTEGAGKSTKGAVEHTCSTCKK